MLMLLICSWVSGFQQISRDETSSLHTPMLLSTTNYVDLFIQSCAGSTHGILFLHHSSLHQDVAFRLPRRGNSLSSIDRSMLMAHHHRRPISIGRPCSSVFVHSIPQQIGSNPAEMVFYSVCMHRSGRYPWTIGVSKRTVGRSMLKMCHPALLSCCLACIQVFTVTALFRISATFVPPTVPLFHLLLLSGGFVWFHSMCNNNCRIDRDV